MLFAKIKYVPKKSCFITIPRNWNKEMQSHQELIFKLETENKTGFFNWDGTYSMKNDEIEINEHFARAIGFDECEVFVYNIENVSVCSQVDLISSPDNLEIIDLNEYYLEETLLNQVKIIWKDQIFPIWINKFPLFVKVIQTYPDATPVKVVSETKLNIKSKKFEYEFNRSDKPSSKEKRFFNHIFSFVSLKKNCSDIYENKIPEQNILMKTSLNSDNFQTIACKVNWTNFISKIPISITVRVIPLEDLFNSNCSSHSKVSDKMKNSIHPSVIYIGISSIKINMEYFIAKITKFLSPSEKDDKKADNSLIQKRKQEKKSDDSQFSSSIVQVIVFNNYEISCSKCFKKELNTVLQTDYVVVPDSLRKILGLEISSQIHLQSIDYEPLLLDEIYLSPVSYMRYDFEKYKSFWYENMCKSTQPFVYCNNTLINFPTENGNGIDFIVKASFKNSSEVNDCQPYGIIIPHHLTKINFDRKVIEPLTVNGIKLPCQNLEIIDMNSVIELTELGGIDALLKKGSSFLELWLNLSPISDSILPKYFTTVILLICGPRGVGKSTLARSLVQKISKSPHYIYHHIISCRKLQGKRAETIWKHWKRDCSEIIHRQPSVLIIDDLDIITPASLTPEQERSTDGLHFHKVVNALLNLIDFIRSSESKICVIITAKSVQSLHPLLTSTRGNHIFQLILEISIPNKEQRQAMLKALIESKSYLALDTKESFLSEFAYKTEGCVTEDLNILVNRATHAAWMRIECEKANTKLQLKETDFNTALKNFLPSCLQGIHLHKSGNKCWSDIGGLSNVKKTLYEILLWPLKYPTLFVNCPIRLQSGILLYGPPGTGKTLLASVIAKESELNFITVKGPEILSKYIGASEQALRNLFENAQSAKPCILFFDEFDALAPRRGHDSTGVTDRIVNQLLTQMDGVEILNGVYILAATSRPDLIDPALLRPGRFDKHLFCPLPNEKERLEILHALSQKLHLSSDVNLEYLAASTSYFSGADLQSLLYSAQIESLHHLNDQRKKNKIENIQEFSELTYIPSLEEGSIGLTEEHKNKILKEVVEIQNNILGRENYTQFLNSQKINQIPYITQNNLINVLSKMKPSVSPNERLRYQFIYDSFRGKSDALQQSVQRKRVTLA